MGLQFSSTVRNAMLDSIETATGTSAKLMFYTGAPPTNCGTAESGTTKIVEFDMASDWADNAAAGSKALKGLPFSVNAVAAGTLGHFRLYAADGVTCHMQGTITATGGGGDLTVDNTSVANGQNINVTGFTLNAPGV